MSLDKVLALAGQTPAQPTREDMASELVASALAGLAELKVYLASGGDDDGKKQPPWLNKKKGDNDSDDDGKGKSGGGDHSGHAGFKAAKKKGMSDKDAAAACAKSDKRVAATDLCEALTIALSALQAPSYDWVEATAVDTSAVALADSDSASKPYGDVAYADPGYIGGKKRYPIDKDHVRAAWSYINQQRNSDRYTSAQLSAIKGKIKSAMRKFGIQVGDSSEKVAATVVDEIMLARAGGGIAMHHAPMTGSHSHPHTQTGVHDHEHQHFNDSNHGGGPMHRQGSTPVREW